MNEDLYQESGMRFSHGTTRVVILIGPYAIKIARFRPIRVLYRLVLHRLNRQTKLKLQQFGDHPLKAGIRYVLAGIVANQQEFMVWSISPRSYMIPSLYSFFGLFNIQLRGEPATEEDLKQGHPFLHLLENISLEGRTDLSQPKNFCRFRRRICIIDYGSDDAVKVFVRNRTISLINAASH